MDVVVHRFLCVAHPPDHGIVISGESLNIFSVYGPSLTAIKQHTAYAGVESMAPAVQRVPSVCEEGEQISVDLPNKDKNKKHKQKICSLSAKSMELASMYFVDFHWVIPVLVPKLYL